jgi:quercetin dioxygenase-like cupin family protein
MLSVVSRAQARTTVTPNATMTTLASPSVGGATRLSLWQVEMKAGQQGPWHTFDTEQLWTVISGSVTVASLDGDAVLRPGDTVVVPAGAERRITAVSDARLIVCGQADGVATARGDEAPRGTPAWIS